MQRLVTLALAGLLLAHLARHEAAPAPFIVSASAPVVVVVAPPPVAVPAPLPTTTAPPPARPRAAPVEDRAGLGPCPAPYTRTGDVPMALPPGFLVEDVAPSAFDVRRLAAWNDDEVRLSVDEGRTWQVVLRHGGRVADATFDCHGRLHVLRDGGWLGTHDDALTGPERERWIQLSGLAAGEDDPGLLVVDGSEVAVIGHDAAVPTRLVLVRRDPRGRWRSAPLVDDDGHGEAVGPWTLVYLDSARPLARGRVRLRASPWLAGDCGGVTHHLVVTFDLGLRHRAVAHFDEYDEGGWAEPTYDGLAVVRRDAAGRWIAVVTDDSAPQLVRLDDAELAARR